MNFKLFIASAAVAVMTITAASAQSGRDYKKNDESTDVAFNHWKNKHGERDQHQNHHLSRHERKEMKRHHRMKKNRHDRFEKRHHSHF